MAQTCRDLGVPVLSGLCDVRDRGDVDRLVTAAAELGQIEAAISTLGYEAKLHPAEPEARP